MRWLAIAFMLMVGNCYGQEINYPLVVKESNLTIGYKGMNRKIDNSTSFTSTVAGKEQFKVYKKSKDEMEYEIILTQKPSKNFWVMNITGWEDFDFYYQKPLINATVKDGIVTGTEPDMPDMIGVTRAENVDGSYAVYHKTKANNQYQTGKAFHIYRPKLIDAKNETSWADMVIDKGKLNITANMSWLNNATYPVIIDPNLGYTIIGGTFSTLSYGYIGNYSNVASSNGTMDRIYVYTNSTNATCKLAIYDKTGVGANPATRLTSSYTMTPAGLNQWNLVNCSVDNVSVINGTYYCPGLAIEASGHGVQYDTAASDGGYSSPITYANWMVSSISGMSAQTTIRVSLYLNYTEGGAPPAVTVYPQLIFID